ncbi:MAG: ISAs1 family transposase [Planctomycetes bacterium]|nr:ISAs1 family transposase [Planctomycetota bacterium]
MRVGIVNNIAYLLASPAARGLFHRAIMQSGASVLNDRGNREEALARGTSLAAALGQTGRTPSLDALRAVDGKSNEITAIPELLDMLAVKGAIVSIDAMGTQKAIAAKILAKEADYVLALKGNHSSLHDDVKRFFDDGTLAETCATHTTTNTGHGRIEERTIRATDAIDWLTTLHPDWKNLRSIAAITAKQLNKKSGQISTETRFYISSLPPNPAILLATTRAHWAIENNLHWQLDLTFREDYCRTRKDFSPLNLAIIRRAVFNILKHDPSDLSMQRKRIKASINPSFRSLLLSR